MHTFHGEHGRVVFVHHGDFSGDVEVVDTVNDTFISVPFTDLLSLVANHRRRELICALEQASDEQVLSWPPGPS